MKRSWGSVCRTLMTALLLCSLVATLLPACAEETGEGQKMLRENTLPAGAVDTVPETGVSQPAKSAAPCENLHKVEHPSSLPASTEEAAAEPYTFLPAEELLDGDVVKFNDETVLCSLQRAFDRDSDYFTTQHMERVRSFIIAPAEGKTVSEVDLSVLQFCTILESVTIECTPVNLTVFSQLPEFSAIQFDSCASIDLLPLASCKKLAKVNFMNGHAFDLFPLAECKKLTEVAILDCEPMDLSPLSSCKSLTTLTLFGDSITDLSTLPSIPKLSALYLKPSAGLTDYTPLGLCSSLKEVYFSGISAEGLTYFLLTQGENLESLSLEDTTLNEYSLAALRGCKKLQELSLTNVQGMDYSALLNCGKLTSLTLDGMPVSESIEALVSMKKLDNLRLINLRGWDLSCVGQMSTLKKLYLQCVDTSDFTFIAALPKLEVLALVAVRPDNFSFLNELTCTKTLKELYINGTKLMDLHFVKNLSRLEHLYLWYNDLSSLSSLVTSTKKLTLGLVENQIRDLSPLSGLEGMDFIFYTKDFEDTIEPEYWPCWPQEIEASEVTDTDFCQLAAEFFGDEASAVTPQP